MPTGELAYLDEEAYEVMLNSSETCSAADAPPFHPFRNLSGIIQARTGDFIIMDIGLPGII